MKIEDREAWLTTPAVMAANAAIIINTISHFSAYANTRFKDRLNQPILHIYV
jgi:hypothetical protein